MHVHTYKYGALRLLCLYRVVYLVLIHNGAPGAWSLQGARGRNKLQEHGFHNVLRRRVQVQTEGGARSATDSHAHAGGTAEGGGGGGRGWGWLQDRTVDAALSALMGSGQLELQQRMNPGSPLAPYPSPLPARGPAIARSVSSFIILLLPAIRVRRSISTIDIPYPFSHSNPSPSISAINPTFCMYHFCCRNQDGRDLTALPMSKLLTRVTPSYRSRPRLL